MNKHNKSKAKSANQIYAQTLPYFSPQDWAGGRRREARTNVKQRLINISQIMQANIKLSE